MKFFGSYIGMYMVQSVVHSLVTLLIVEMSLRIWQIECARERFRYRLLVIVLPFFMYPAFQLVNPERGSFYFIEDAAFFSSLGWMNMKLFHRFPLGILFIGMVLAVSVLAMIQEVIPIAGDFLRKKRPAAGRPEEVAVPAGEELELMVDEMSRGLKMERPPLVVIDDEHPLIYAAGTKSHDIVVSRGLFAVLDSRQLRSALCHELAHILRRSAFTTLLVFMVRICMFYNPVSLLEFRRLVQDDELICDDITVSITGDPGALASALRVFCSDVPSSSSRRISDLKDAIEISSHNLLLEERISRLENRTTCEYMRPGPERWPRYALTLAAIAGINYFVV